MSDQIRELLQQLDPMRPGVAAEPVTVSPSRERLENIMSTPIIDARSDSRRIRPWFRPAVALAAVVALVVGAWAVLAQGEDRLELTLPDGGPMASCLPVTPERLREMPVAFEGTVTDWSDDVVTLRVDEWYRGGSSSEVELHGITDMEIMVSPIDFRVGESYLITATDGSVNYCGYSAPATAQLRSIFEQAYLP